MLFEFILYNSILLISFGQSDVLTPILTKIRTIASDPTGTLRDPSAVLFDPITRTWNFWTTYVKNGEGESGYPGRIHHYYSSTLDAIWNTSGIAINVSSNPNDFDYYGVFTPEVTYDNITNEWIIYYGGVRDSSSSHAEQIGIAVSKNGVFGPFIKNNTENPVIKYQEIFWCDSSGPARVDEANPYIIKNKKMIYTKCVCNNFTALDGIFISKDDEYKSWNPPYNISSSVSPIINSLGTVEKKGFEQLKIFMGPDGYLHLTGHNHGNSQCPHYISDDNNNGFKWKFINYMEFGEGNTYEPVPVYPEGIPGDQGGVPKYFIEFVTTKKPYYIDLLNVSWVPTNQTYESQTH